MKHLMVVLGAAASLVSGSALAATYKCTDASGKVSYQQQPCPSTSTATTMNIGNPAWSLLKTEGGLMGSVQLFFDAANIPSEAGLKRTRFKQVVTGTPTNVPDRYFFHYFDCAKNLVSQEVTEGEQRQDLFRARLANRDSGFWHAADGWFARTNREYLYPLLPKVCPPAQ